MLDLAGGLGFAIISTATQRHARGFGALLGTSPGTAQTTGFTAGNTEKKTVCLGV